MLKIRALLFVFVISALVGAGAQAATKKASAYKRSEATSEFPATDSPLNHRLEIEPSFGMAFLSPSDINNAIHDANDSLQKQGFKGFNVGDIGSTVSYGAAATYKVIPGFGLGLGVYHLGATTDGSAKVGNNTLTGTDSIGATLLTLETRITALHSDDRKFEGLISPSLGLGFFNASTQLSGSALPASRQVDSSSKGAVFGIAVGARYWLMPSLALGLNAGYRYAKSGDLKIDSAKGTDDAVGSNLDSGGKKVSVDASSVLIATQLVWSI